MIAESKEKNDPADVDNMNGIVFASGRYKKKFFIPDKYIRVKDPKTFFAEYKEVIDQYSNPGFQVERGEGGYHCKWNISNEDLTAHFLKSGKEYWVRKTAAEEAAKSS